MAEDNKSAELPIDFVVEQAEDLFDSGNRWDAIELLNTFQENISPADADAQLLYCRVAESFRDNEEYAGAHKALVQAFVNRSDANAVHDAVLVNGIEQLKDNLSGEQIDVRGKNDLLEQLNVMHSALSPLVHGNPAPVFKPQNLEEEHDLHYEIA